SSFLLLALAGCGGGWFMQQREPWRHDAELACLKSGQVKISPAVAQMSPISGPGICGADFPLKVAALGDSPAPRFAAELRPPAPLPQYRRAPSRPAAPGYGGYTRPAYPEPYGQADEAVPQTDYPARPGAPGPPLSIRPPGLNPDEAEPYPAPPGPS